MSVQVEERNGRSLLGRQRAQGKVEVLVLKGRIGSRAADQCPRLVDAFHRAATCLVAEESVVGNLEKPRSELALVTITCQREVGLHQGILRQVVGIIFLATAQGEQETSQGLLLTFHMRYEYFACHRLHLLDLSFLLGLNLLGEHLRANTVVDEESDAYAQGNQTETGGGHGIVSAANMVSTQVYAKPD